MPLSQVDVVWGDTDRCPYSVGESGSRTTIMTGYAVVEAARDLKKQIAEKGMPTGRRCAHRVGQSPIRGTDGKVRNCFGAHFVEVEVDTQLGTVKVTKYVAVHESGRIMNPQTAKDQIRGAAHAGHRTGAARGSALRPAKRPAADRRLLRRPAPHPSRRGQHRGHLHRSRRWLRAVRRQDHRRVGIILGRRPWRTRSPTPSAGA